MVNNCEKCESDYQRVREEIAKHFAPEALTVISLALATFMKNQSALIASMPWEDIRRQAVKRDQDFTAMVMGKILMAMPPEQEKAILKVLKKQGIDINVRHDGCRHNEISEERKDERPNKAN